MAIQAEMEIDIDGRPVLTTLTEAQNYAYQKMLGVITYFFTRATEVSLKPFRGFLLEGPPASGKTEVAFQVSKSIKTRLAKARPPIVVKLRFIDSSVIAASHWGEAERRLTAAFDMNQDGSERLILVIDDIDCLMIARGSQIAKEWHYSINAVIFHLLDRLDPTKAMIIATTNRPDLIDEALRSRLYSIYVSAPRKEEILSIAKQMAELLHLGQESEQVAKSVVEKLSSLQGPTIRDVQHLLIEECIESGLWRAEL